MTVKELFRAIRNELKDAGIESSELEASWILETTTGIGAVKRMQEPQTDVPAEAVTRAMRCVERRKRGEPLAYVLGERGFYGLRFQVSPEVLIPRPETEVLAEWAIRWLKTKAIKAPTILDLGVGSGCLGLSVLHHTPDANLTAVDLSVGAIEIAQKNATALNLYERVEWMIEDAAQAIGILNSKGAKFDLVVANPPYIAHADVRVDEMVRRYEPAAALFAGNDGFAAIEAWLKPLPGILKNQSGAVAFEVGAGQAQAVAAMFRDLGIFSKQYILNDYAGHERIVCGER